MRHIVLRWSSTPAQHRQDSHLYRQMRIGAAQRELSRPQGQFPLLWLHPGLPRPLNSHLYCHYTQIWAHVLYKALDGLRWLGKITHRAPSDPSFDTSYIMRFLGDLGPITIDLQPARHSTTLDDDYGSWCLQRHRTENLARVECNGAVTRQMELAPLPLSPLASPASTAESSWFCFVLFSPRLEFPGEYLLTTSTGFWLILNSLQ